MRTFDFTLIVMLAAGLLVAGCKKRDEREGVEYKLPNGKQTSDVNDMTDGKAEYEIVGGIKVPAKAEQLHREARAKGQSGDYTSALALLRRASEIAPDWPYPHYDMAFTYLLQGDVTNALENYRQVERMEPRGFFTTKTALWTLERETKGIFPKGTYLAFVSLEWAEPEKKPQMIEQMTTNLPTFAPAWKERALLVDPADQRLAFIEKTLSLDPDLETYGICMLNKAALLNRAGKVSEAKQMLNDLIRNDSSTPGTKSLAKELLKSITK